MLIDRPLFAETVVWRGDPEYRFDVDGHPFPWHLDADRPAVFRELAPNAYAIDLRILPVDRVTSQPLDVRFIPPEGRPLIGGREFPWAILDTTVVYTATSGGGILELTMLANAVDTDTEVAA